MDAVSRDCPTRPTTLALKLKFECYIAVLFALAVLIKYQMVLINGVK